MDIGQASCSRKTCPNYQKKPHVEGSSSQKSSTPDCSDKQTQKTPIDLSSEVATGDKSSRRGQSAATSETHFNRNHENLNTPQQPSCPTYAPQCHPTCLHSYPPTATNCPLINESTCRPPSITYACPYMSVPLITREPVSSLSQQSTCESQNEISTSSNSTTSEPVPIGLLLNIKNIAKKYPNQTERIVVPWSYPRPERLQPCNTKHQQFVTPPSPTTTEEDEEYFSCSSESSGSGVTSKPDNLGSKDKKYSKRCKKRNRKMETALQLLHKVVRLMTEDAVRGKDRNPPATNSAGNTTSSLFDHLDTCDPRGAHQALVANFKDKICDLSSELQTLLGTETPPTNDLQSPTNECPCPETKEPRLAFSTTTETLEDEDCDWEEALQKAKAESPHSQFVPPPWPCFCYYLATLFASQGWVLSELLGQYPPVSNPPIPKEESQLAKQEEGDGQCPPKQEEIVELICMCSKSTEICPKHGPINEEEILDEKDNDSRLIKPDEDSAEPFNPIYDDYDKEEMSYSEKEPQPTEGIKLEMINDYIDPHILALESLEQIQNHGTYPDPDYDDTDPPYSQIPIDAVGSYEKRNFVERGVQGSGPPSVHGSQYKQEALLEDAYDQLLENLFPGGLIGRDDEDNRDNFGDNSCEEFDEDEECELEKEKRAERQKSRSHKDPCVCCHCQATRQSTVNKCMALAPMHNDSEVEEFKYFVDSIIMDLEAMEHARRKCSARKNLCAPKPRGCARESYPVTITDVEELGTTSLYIKWIIHDCYGIGGYEIFVDGYLTNRYYHSGHTAGVVTDVDVTIPHKVAIVAQPNSMQDNSLQMICDSSKTKTKCKSLPWNTEVTKDLTSTLQTPTASLWTPSIYLYDPENKALPTFPILNNNNI